MAIAASAFARQAKPAMGDLSAPSLIVSALMHGLLFAAMIFGLPYFASERTISEPAPIFLELAPIAEISNPPPPSVKAPDPEPEPPKAEPTPPTPQPAPTAQPAPKPDPAPTARAEAKPEPKPAPEPAFDPTKLAQNLDRKLAEQKPAPKPEPKPEDKAFDPSQLGALIDKAAQNAPPPAPDAGRARSNQTAVAQNHNPNLPISMTERDFIRTQVERNWGFDPGARGIEDFIVRVSFSLNPDGTLRDQPKILDTARMNMPGQDAYRAFAERARRAVLRAAPFQMPPGGDPARWNQEIILIFNPKNMVGG